MNETARTCGATTKSGGTPCARKCAAGFTRCNLHGGHTPLARQAAAETLARAALPAAEVMFDIIDQWQRTTCAVCGMPSGDPSPVIRAAQIVLDRTGFHPKLTVEQPATPPNLYADLTDDEMVERFEALLAAAIARRDEHRAHELPEHVDGVLIDEHVVDDETAIQESAVQMPTGNDTADDGISEKSVHDKDLPQ